MGEVKTCGECGHGKHGPVCSAAPRCSCTAFYHSWWNFLRCEIFHRKQWKRTGAKRLTVSNVIYFECDVCGMEHSKMIWDRSLFWR